MLLKKIGLDRLAQHRVATNLQFVFKKKKKEKKKTTLQSAMK